MGLYLQIYGSGFYSGRLPTFRRLQCIILGMVYLHGHLGFQIVFLSIDECCKVRVWYVLSSSQRAQELALQNGKNFTLSNLLQ